MKLITNYPRQQFFIGDLVQWNRKRISGVIVAFYLDDDTDEPDHALVVFAPGLYDGVALEKSDYEYEDDSNLLENCYGMDYCAAHFSEMTLIESPSRIKTLEEILFDL